MNEHEIENNIEMPDGDQESTVEVETQSTRNEMAAIESDIEAGNTLTPELLNYFQELGGKLADQETDGETARFMLAYDSAALKFKSGFIAEAIYDLKELGDAAYQRGEQFDQIVEMADERRASYEAVLAKQPKP